MDSPNPVNLKYRGRIAPSPTGFLHLGHARTFWVAHQRARRASGELVFRMDDLDSGRVRDEFTHAAIDDLRWLGLTWDEGPDVGGRFGPYSQSARRERHRSRLEQLKIEGFVYPCTCSRADILTALQAPHAGQEEPIYPGTCRQRTHLDKPGTTKPPAWRFRVSDGEVVEFTDLNLGPQRFVCGVDFGDFVVWRPDDMPSYQLACVVDDADMHISEVVRGEDLLISTARQILLYRRLGLRIPTFYHCPLVLDSEGVRLAKRHAALSLRQLRRDGVTTEDLLERIQREDPGTGFHMAGTRLPCNPRRS